MTSFRPDTELMVVVTDANGATKTLDSNARDPGDRPQGLSFSTKLGAGFDVGGFNLSRLIDRDNIDVHLLDNVTFMGANGDTAYEGFVGELPRTMDTNGHTLTVTTAGWMAHTSDEPFTQVFVDRDMTRWEPMSQARRIALIQAPQSVYDAGVKNDETTGAATLAMEVDGGSVPISEAVYRMPSGSNVASIYYAWQRDTKATSTNWLWQVGVLQNDNFSGGSQFTADLQAEPTATGAAYFTATTPYRYGFLQFQWTSTAIGQAGAIFALWWHKLAVYGNHGLTLIGSTDPKGVSGSAVITYLVKLYAPKLNTSGVQTTTYPIAHLVFADSTTVYDAILKINSYHLWNFAVWENRVLHYAPTDMTDWDWEIRHDEVGNQIGLQGDSVQDLRNGIIVDYTNVATGATDRLLPADHVELRDLSFDNPANIAGRKMYGSPFQIPFPTTAADALELGRIRLQEDLAPKAPGSFTVEGHVKDRAGNYQPAWKVRAGDRIRLTSSVSLSDRPRLVNETQYSHDSRSVTIGVDSTLRYVEGYLDRVTTALQAAGLT